MFVKYEFAPIQIKKSFMKLSSNLYSQRKIRLFSSISQYFEQSFLNDFILIGNIDQVNLPFQFSINTIIIISTIMQDNIHSMRQWYQISEVEFGFMFPEELRRLSVCEIEKSQVYDAQKKPVKGGLYDPLMGVSPNDRDAVCATCGHKGLECSGHPGHIELIVPAYNPLIIDVLLKLLKMTCLNCHKFRIRQRIKEDYVVLLQLLRKDRIKQAYEYYQINVEEEKRKLDKLEAETEAEKTKEQYKIKLSKCKERLAFADKMKAQCHLGNKSIPSSTSIQLFSQFSKFLGTLTQNKCPYLNCKKESKKIKKQGASKIFLMDRDVEEDEQNNNNSSTNIRKKSRDSLSKGQSTAHPQPEKEVKKSKQRYITPKQVYNELRKVWLNESELVKVMFGNQKHTNSFTMFFINVVFVPPNRFRPESKLGQEKYLHDHTTILARVIETNNLLKQFLTKQFKDKDKDLDKNKFINQKDIKYSKIGQLKKTQFYGHALRRLKGQHDFINKWLELQDSINCFIDSSKSSRMADKDFKGVRQILQKKEGLFRMKMMGKRVNFAARSVISPDPSLNTDQVGIPLFMSKKLTFCEHINEYNLEKLQSFIINGQKYPGANFIEQNGKITKLDLLSEQQRISHARNLWNNHENKIVYRHIQTGDNVLFNRQPTLHKAGLMAHRVKVLPKQSTLRMNYANCKSYNADFDGDEMNLHALQTYMAKAEAELCISDQLYENPTNGKPLRQIMQDAIISAVYLSMRDLFFEKSDFSQLLYQSTFSLFNQRPKNCRIFLVKPAIQKPKLLWTGKQLITNVIKVVVQLSDLKFKNQKGLTMKSSTKISKNYLKGYEEEAQVVFVNNEFLKGFIDKNQVGSNSDFGFLHSFTELYGEATTGKLMTCLNKLFLTYMQTNGFTCGVDDLILKKKVNKTRKQMLETVHQQTVSQICQAYGQPAPKDIFYMGRDEYKCDEKGQPINEQKRIHVHKFQEIVRYFEYKIVNEEHALQQLDGEYKHHLNEKASNVIDHALSGFQKQFPKNNFSMMTVTGAKGSNVNHSQVSVLLGQQQLEGKRVPMMITGKTLPSFTAYDPNPRASGFISDRFLSGLRQQQFYFHCMAGRQGLIDTAVKTSRSGYLQRCLMKHLQSLKVEYDLTVRDSDGSIVQFLYGEDGLNPTKDKFFSKLDFLKNNRDTFKAKLKYNQFKQLMITKEVNQFKAKQAKKQIQGSITIHQKFNPTNNLGSISQKYYEKIMSLKPDIELQDIYALKYKKGMIEPGQAVGCTAAQSIGEPSTQMTLNTFHLAGHGGVNLTLGIPRLRQLLMTSSDKIKTPIMELYFKNDLTKSQAVIYSKHLEKVKLRSLIKNVSVQQWKELYTANNRLLDYHQRKRYYKINLEYEKEQFIIKQFGISFKNIEDKIRNILMVQLLGFINRVKKRNDLRAQIKRTHHQKQVQEDQEQDSDSNGGEKQNPENQKDKIEEEEPIQKALNYHSNQFEKINFSEHSCQITIKVALNMKKFLMTKVIQRLLASTIMKQIQGINSVVVLDKKGVPYLQTEGVNFDILQIFPFLDEKKVRSNDIQAFAKKFGIQAARNVLISQIVSLFGAYGVTVDYRHMYLIGDYVTFGGVIKAMNRNWMNYNPSPFLRMTFETSVKYITDSALRCQVDRCKTPSSKIIMGQCPELGTGLHELLMDVDV